MLKKLAVIDIGSNSVRLVVYESLNRVPYVLFNEKVLCSLGLGVSETGRMMEKSMRSALATLKRFSILLYKMEVEDCRVIATSAVRDSKNGPDFIKTVWEQCALEIQLLSGEEEARLSGYGVLCAIPEAHGIVGDLGGGSLEFAGLANGEVTDKVSLPAGPLQFQDQDWHLFNSPKRKIEKMLSGVKWLEDGKGKPFYAVGGGWRALARIHLVENNYPHSSLHHYTIGLEEALSFTRKISKMSPIELEKHMVYISPRRIRVLPLAALALYLTLKRLKPSHLVISGFGVREGLLFDAMSEEVRKQDPLIVGCHEVAEMTGRFSEHGKRLRKWIDPLFINETAEDKRLRLAICMLSDVGWRGHPEYRAAKVVFEILYGRLIGIDHRGTGLIGLALYVCYGGNIRDDDAGVARALISRDDAYYATRIGLALRLAQRLSAGTERGLKAVSVEIRGDELFLNVKQNSESIYNEVVGRRLSKLAQALDLTEKVTFLPQAEKE